MTIFNTLESAPPQVLDVWRSPSVARKAEAELDSLPNLDWRDSVSPEEMHRALASGDAQVILLTLDDILGSGYEGVPAQARAVGAWLLVMVPEPHPFFELVADRRLLVRQEAIPQVLQGLMRNMLGTG